MGQARLFGRYRQLQSYVGWTDADEGRIRLIAPSFGPHLPGLIDDFYAEILRHPEVSSVITGGEAQIARLKGSLLGWVKDLLSGDYDEAYVGRRWQVGRRHVEIGLDQIFTNAALSRLRIGLLRVLCGGWTGELHALTESALSLTRLLDLDMAIIEDAYQAEASAKLQRTERLATMGQIAGGIGHELRNPLNVVKTSVYFLLNARNPSSEKAVEHLRRIERNVELADGVITTLTSFARMPIPEIRPVPVDRCIHEALELNDPGPRIETVFLCPTALPRVLADVDQLRIVFGNLIRNARDAMSQEGRLTIRATPIEGGVAVEVSDTGTGIPPEILARITEPLYSTKARGLGLGLAIVRAILDKIEGQLVIVSEPGAGSRFTVKLKAATTPAGAE